MALIPPTTAPDQVAWLRLIRSRRVGPSTFQRLLADYGSAQEALNALPDIANAAGVSKYSPYSESAAIAEFKEGREKGYHMLFLGSDHYPKNLAACPDAPPILWADGDLSLLKRPSIALIGARNASSIGTRMARLLARELAKDGRVIVSGLARGIDAAAHAAALETGTIAVIASGLNLVYPSENAELSRDISKKGLRLSEQPLDLAPQARHFPQRNRIVAALTDGVVVVEGAARSGSLITARQALDYGREVMAVPGNPLDARAAGCNILIRDGATLVRSASDILETLAKPAQTVQAQEPAKPADMTNVDRSLLDLLSTAPVPEDTLIRDSGLPAQAVAQQLLDLELDGKVQRYPGGLLALTA